MLNEFSTAGANTPAVPSTNKQETGDSCKTIAGFKVYVQNYYRPNRSAVGKQRQLK